MKPGVWSLTPHKLDMVVYTRNPTHSGRIAEGQGSKPSSATFWVWGQLRYMRLCLRNKIGIREMVQQVRVYAGWEWLGLLHICSESRGRGSLWVQGQLGLHSKKPCQKVHTALPRWLTTDSSSGDLMSCFSHRGHSQTNLHTSTQRQTDRQAHAHTDTISAS